MQSSSRLARPPERAYTRFGFGLGPVHNHAWTPRRDAVRRVRDLFDRSARPEWTYENFQALVAVKDLFNNIRCENTFDWFTTCRLFGTPSGKLAGRFQKGLKQATEALRRGDLGQLDSIFDGLGGNAFGDMLDAYDAATRPSSPAVFEDPYGWVGIVWSSASPGEVFVRTTAGRPGSLLPDAAGRNPFGLLAAWNVSDAHVAQEELAELFDDTLEVESISLRRHDSHLLQMKQQVEALLSRENIMALSPWHRIKAAAPASDFADATPASASPSGFSEGLPREIGELFSAFGRR